ncbi:hypothetical protein ACGFI4_31310 [Micromonospora carbonacea]|uniref:hypothetical protein n=1 Tax=Micromonospora carbonacea TaxID=47853 RepID=UPI00371B9432
MTSRDDALRALNDSDWSGAEVDHSTAKVVHSTRLPPEVSSRLEAEAHRRGITPSALICELVDAGLAPVADDTTVTVRAADLRRAIDNVIHDAAA